MLHTLSPTQSTECYVGETNTPMNHRVNNRPSVDLQREDILVARCLNLPSHIETNMGVLVIDLASNRNEEVRLSKFWINQPLDN